MATPPPFGAYVQCAQSFGSSVTPKTAAVAVVNGDILVVTAWTSDSANTLSTPTDGSLTYALAKKVEGVGSRCNVYIWTAPSLSTQSLTVSVARSAGSGRFGFGVQKFGANGGVGASNNANSASGTPSVGLTTTGANSAIVGVAADWNGADGATRAYLTVNTSGTEETYDFQTGSYTSYGWYHSDSGAAGAKTVGMSAPTQAWSIVVAEISGTGGAAPAGPVYPVSQYSSFH
jgi:hypothetical protein